MKNSLKHFLAAGLFLCRLPAGLICQEAEETWRKDLAGPATVLHRNGNAFTGQIERANDEGMALKAAADEGEVVYRFTREEVKALRLPGEKYKLLAETWFAEGKREKTLKLVRALFRQREKVWAYMPSRDAQFFVPWIRVFLDEDQPEEAAAMADMLAPYVRGESARRALADAALLARHRLGRVEETREMARRWVDEASSWPESALGWWLLAWTAFEEQNYESALETALRPVVFSGAIPPEYLEHCYATAVAAAEALGEEKKAAQLMNEMGERGLSWPEESGLIPPGAGKLPQVND